MTSIDPTLDLEAANKLAYNIRQYWHNRGYNDVSTQVTEQRVKESKKGSHRSFICFNIRSNLINGVPPSWRGPVAKYQDLEKAA
jgi:hypothetical protein